MQIYNDFEVLPTLVTGSMPSCSWGICGGRPDFSYDVAWGGSIDATDAMPSGSMRMLELTINNNKIVCTLCFR